MNIAKSTDSMLIAGLKPIYNEQTPSVPAIEVFNEDLRVFSENFLAFAKKCNSPKLAGLAANQLAFENGERVMKNVCAIMSAEGDWIIAINSKVYQHVENKEVSIEGCLTWPKKSIHADRYINVSIEYQDLNGEKKHRVATGFEAAVWQHEINHLNGVREIVVNPKTGTIYGPSLENGGMLIVKNKIGRNDPCSCESGKKYKKCCGR